MVAATPMLCPASVQANTPHELTENFHRHCPPKGPDAAPNAGPRKPCGWLVCDQDQATVDILTGRWFGK